MTDRVAPEELVERANEPAMRALGLDALFLRAAQYIERLEGENERLTEREEELTSLAVKYLATGMWTEPEHAAAYLDGLLDAALSNSTKEGTDGSSADAQEPSSAPERHCATCKTCTKCRTLKPVAEFRRRPSSSDGFDSWCVECGREASRLWRLAHGAEYQRSYRKRDPKRARVWEKRWRAENGETVQAKRRRRRARGAGAGTDEHRRSDVWAKTGGRCYICGEPLGAVWHEEHRVPIVLGGSDTLENCWPACAPCNLAKGAQSPDAFFGQQSLGSVS